MKINDIVLRKRMRELEAIHGGLRNAAKRVGIDHGYWSRLKYGEKRNPSDSVLGKMNLRKVVSYELIA